MMHKRNNRASCAKFGGKFMEAHISDFGMWVSKIKKLSYLWKWISTRNVCTSKLSEKTFCCRRGECFVLIEKKIIKN